MIRYYHSTARQNKISEILSYKKGSWIDVYAPTQQELELLVKDFDLDADLLNDAMDLYEAPRIEIEQDKVYCFSRYYHTDDQVINATEPILFIYDSDFLMTVTRIDSGLLSSKSLLALPAATTQKTKLLLQFMAVVNQTYQNYINKTTRHILKVRTELKTADINSSVLLSLVQTSDDLNEILSALQSHGTMLRNLLAGRHIKMFEEDKDLVEDLLLSTEELVELVKSRLKSVANIRQTYDALATAELNRTFKRLTSISIFLMVPTIFVGLYGMNILLPFQNDTNAFWIVMVLIVLSTALVFYYFNKKRWY